MLTQHTLRISFMSLHMAMCTRYTGAYHYDRKRASSVLTARKKHAYKSNIALKDRSCCSGIGVTLIRSVSLPGHIRSYVRCKSMVASVSTVT